MSPVLPSLLPQPLLVADRGAAGHEAADTLSAHQLALRLGATALGGTVWATADGRAVLRGDDRLGRLGRRRLRDVVRADLPPDVLDVEELLAVAGAAVPVLLDVGDPAALDDVVARASGSVAGLWVCGPDLEALAAWRSSHPGVRAVWTTVLRQAPGGPERAAARLRDAGIDGLRLRHDEWSGGLTTLVHRFGRLAFAGGVDHTRVAVALLRMGIDGMWSPFPDRLADAARGAAGTGAGGGPGPADVGP